MAKRRAVAPRSRPIRRACSACRGRTDASPSACWLIAATASRIRRSARGKTCQPSATSHVSAFPAGRRSSIAASSSARSSVTAGRQSGHLRLSIPVKRRCARGLPSGSRLSRSRARDPPRSQSGQHRRLQHDRGRPDRCRQPPDRLSAALDREVAIARQHSATAAKIALTSANRVMSQKRSGARLRGHGPRDTRRLSEPPVPAPRVLSALSEPNTQGTPGAATAFTTTTTTANVRVREAGPPLTRREVVRSSSPSRDRLPGFAKPAIRDRARPRGLRTSRFRPPNRWLRSLTTDHRRTRAFQARATAAAGRLTR